MKKTLIALATLAATASFAQSTVSIDGLVDAGVASINYKGANNTATGIIGNGSGTTQLNFRGSEDLGGGLKANFRFESQFNAVSNRANQGAASSPVIASAGGHTLAAPSSFGSGEIRLGLSGGFGSVDAGAVNYNSLTSYTTGQPFGTGIGSGFRTMYINDVQSTSQTRAENSVRWVSPAFNGFNASVYWSGKQNKAVNSPNLPAPNVNVYANNFSTAMGAYDQQGTTELGLNYRNGPIAASFSQMKVNLTGVSSGANALGTAETVGNGASNATVNTFGANYTVGAFRAFGLYQTRKTADGTTSNKTMSASATYTMGSVVLMAQAGNLENVAGVKSTLTGIGADYNLSKRTALYLRSESINDKANAMNSAVNPATITGVASTAGLADQKFGRTAVGVRHTF
jgi:predicted porin